MLKFEFVQPGEFEEPHYVISRDGEYIVKIIFNDDEWVFDYVYPGYCLTYDAMLYISEKLKQLNQATKSQRILGVF